MELNSRTPHLSLLYVNKGDVQIQSPKSSFPDGKVQLVTEHENFEGVDSFGHSFGLGMRKSPLDITAKEVMGK